MVRIIVSSIGSFIRGLFNRENYTLHNLVLFVVVLMCIQYLPLEGVGISAVKVLVMSVMPFVLLTHLRINKALMLGGGYILWLYITAAIIHPATFRSSTFLYSIMFVVTFVVVYSAVWDYRVLKLNGFLRFLRILFYVLIGFLLAQQLCIVVGIRYMPAINLCYYLDRGIGTNSLSLEPSHLGRLLAVMYYAILKCTEYRRGEKVKISEIFDGDLKWVSIFYLWAVLTMGSGTAFVAAGITSLYFMRGRHLFLAIPIFIGTYFALEHFGNESFARAQRASVATMTGDVDNVREADGSAAVRIAPILNTLNADFSDVDFWIGKGTDSTSWLDLAYGRGYIGHINDYGLISYIFELLIVFSCCINLRSLATLYFICGVGGGIGNVAYGWGILMIFCCLKYFNHYRYSDYEYYGSK